ncbi:DUF1857-domain-containing protein [Podospora conica]|nr:DUF1857-domain-containing protein [Schizothecium conicum]
MVTINLAYTAPINRPTQTPILTPSQVWAGLVDKVLHPAGFVPLIVDCTVVSTTPATASDPLTVTRLVTFRGREDAPVKEVCAHHPPVRVDFYQPETGSRIGNYISQGPSGEEGDLFMTFVFEWRHEGVEEGSEEARGLEEGYKVTAKKAVEGTIEATRRMVSEGKI